MRMQKFSWFFALIGVFGLFLILPITVDAVTVGNITVGDVIGRNMTINLFEELSVSDKFSFAIEVAEPDEEVIYTLERLPKGDFISLAAKTTDDCYFIIKDLKTFSEHDKLVYAVCVEDKTVIELMNSPNIWTILGYVIGIVGILIGIFITFRKKILKILRELRIFRIK